MTRTTRHIIRVWLGVVALIVASIVALVVRPQVAHAGPSTTEAELRARQVLIALRVMAYDRSLEEAHPGDVVTVAVVSSATAPGRAHGESWRAGFGLLPKVRVSGRRVRVVAIELESADKLAAALAQHGAAALIVTADLDREAAAIARVTRKLHVLTFTSSEQAARAGLSIGLLQESARVEIVINVAAARAEGSQFGAGLLQLARRLDGGS